MPVIPALRRLKQKGHELETSLGYLARPCLKTKEKEREKEKRKRKRERKHLKTMLLQ
jgi:hypothetical protein